MPKHSSILDIIYIVYIIYTHIYIYIYIDNYFLTIHWKVHEINKNVDEEVDNSGPIQKWIIVKESFDK